MEPLRPLVDRKLIAMMRSRSFAAGDFYIHPSGAVRLNPKLAKYVTSAIQVEQEKIKRVGDSVLVALKNPGLCS
jgi:hypothetical protein